MAIFSHSTSMLIYPKSCYPKLSESPELRQIAMGHMLAIRELRFVAGCMPTKHFNCYPNFWGVILQSLFWAGGLLTICKPSSLVKDKHITLRYAYEQKRGARLFIQTREEQVKVILGSRRNRGSSTAISEMNSVGLHIQIKDGKE